MPIAALPARERLRLPGETAIAWAVFDPDWYLANHPDAAAQLADHSAAAVLAWYFEHGQRLGHSPTICFDETWHRLAYPAVAAAVRAGEVESAFDAYCRGGFRARSPHWLFDEMEYRGRYPDISDAALEGADLANGYDHFLRHGNFEHRIGHLFFDAALYCSELEPDGAARAQARGPFLHYLRRIRAPVPEPRTTAYFDPAWYLAHYKDVAASLANGTWLCALHHYLCNDTPTAFDPLPDYSEQFYLTRNPDLAAAIGRGELRNGYVHFLHHGVGELRSPGPSIDLRYYAMQATVRDDLEQRRAPNAFWHWLRIGSRQGLHSAPPPEEIVTEGQARTLWHRRAASLLPVVARTPLDFTCSGAPSVSVVVVLKDAFAETLLTLDALRHSFAGDIELILIDAGSTDESRNIGRYARGAYVLPIEMDVGLLAGRNAALYVASAGAVLLLHAGTELAPGALEAALQRLAATPDIGAIGARMIRPHSHLAEAGGIVWRDGSTEPYLRDGDPSLPEALFRRSVDFCGSACLLLRTAPLRETEAYDDSFASGLYADADLCRRLASAGYRTEYDPAFTAYAYGRLSTTAEDTRQQDRDAFRAKHGDWLATRPERDPWARVFARSNDTGRRVLFVEDKLPLRRIGSGFVRSNDLLHVMAGMGYQVTVFPMNDGRFDLAAVYADMPPNVEVMHDRSFDQLADFLRHRRGYYDAVWVARAHNLDQVRPILEQADDTHPPRLILDSEAIAALRMAHHAALNGEPAADIDAAIVQEFAGARHCQHVVAVNEAEARALRGLGLADITVIGHMRTPTPTPRPFDRRAGMLFVGAIHDTDSPNYDSLCWFVDAVLPLVERELRWQTRLTAAGYVAPEVSLDRFRSHPRVTLRGPVADLVPLYDSHRLFVAPTRFAAGMPYKVHEAASFGLPVVATTLLCEQLDWQDGQELLAADVSDPALFAHKIVTLYRDDALWQRLRDAALARVARDNRPEDVVAAISRVLGPAVRDVSPATARD